MKYFLLIAGECYYPGAATQDWIKTFETREEAESVVNKIEGAYYTACRIFGHNYDWYEVVDLRKWIEGEANE